MVSGFIDKELLQVKGDGQSTLERTDGSNIPGLNSGWKKWNTGMVIGLTG